LAGAAIAGRQILLHIVPGTGTYGEALWGLHLYTLAFIAFAAMIAGTAILLLLERSPEADEGPAKRAPMSRAALAAVALLTVLTLGNVLGTLLECGGGMCADDPVIYDLLGR
ncbi:disulfide bond formation protein B, partial [Ralstonia pseudosolanacearum]